MGDGEEIEGDASGSLATKRDEHQRGEVSTWTGFRGTQGASLVDEQRQTHWLCLKQRVSIIEEAFLYSEVTTISTRGVVTHVNTFSLDDPGRAFDEKIEQRV